MPRSSSALLSSLKLSTLILCILIFSTFSFAAPPNRVAAPIVATQTVRLAAGVPMQARPEFDQGAVDPSLKMSMTLLTVPSASQQHALTKLLADQQNPSSASYHKWLTPEQYADRFGLSLNDVAKLTTWLQSQGFSVVETARGRNWIVFSGTAAQVEKSFQTQIHNFKANGETHFANTVSPSIPAALSGVVVGLRGLNNFPARSNAQRAKPGYTLTVGGNPFMFAAPGDIASIYDVNTLIGSGTDGTGQTLAIIGETDVYLDDLNNFRSGFNINAISGCTTNSTGVITSCGGGNFQYVFAEATGTDPGSPNSLQDDLPEADIDLEWSNAVARNAKIAYVNAPLTGVFTAAYYAIDHNIAPVITMSYGNCELFDGNILAEETELQKANSFGITFMNSSGDTGAAECDFQSNLAIFGYAVGYPASSPEVTGVGGTSIPAIDPNNEYSSTYWNPSNGTDGGSAKGYIPEQPWNDAEEFGLLCTLTNPCTLNFQTVTDWVSAQAAIGISAGGGGVSNCFTTDANGVCTGGFPRPSWQAGISAITINPSGAGETTTPARYSPDVSLLGSPNFPGYIVCTAQSEFGGANNTSVCTGGAAGITSMLTACVSNPQTGPCSIFGGTSVSSPVFAGMVTLLNQYLVAKGVQATPGLGNINPMLYSLAAANSTNKAFNSVTTPNTGAYSDGAWCQAGTPTSGVPADPWPVALQCPAAGFLGFDAFNSDSTTGYNLVAGLGSVDAGNLFAAWVASVSDFTLSAAPSSLTITPGAAGGTSTITVTSSGGFTGSVSFTASGLPSGVTASFNPTSSTTSSVLTLTASSSAPAGGPTTVTITGTSGSLTHTTTIALTVTPPADFTISDAPSSLTISPGAAGGTSIITVTPTNGFTGTVTFLASGLPSGVTASFNPTSSTTSSTLTLTASSSAPGSGPTTVTITGTSGSLTATTTLALTVNQNFTIPGTLTSPPAANPGQTTSTTMSISAVGGGPFSGNVTYTCSAGLPTGATCSFSPAQINATASSPQPVTITVQTAGPFMGSAGSARPGDARRKLLGQKQPLWLPLSLPLAGMVLVGLAGRGLPRRYKIIGLCLAVALTGFLVACGGGSSSPPPVVAVSPSTVNTLYPSLAGAPAQTQQFSATVSNTTSQTVTWAVGGVIGGNATLGTITAAGLYTAPATLPNPNSAITITATSAATSTPGSATVNLLTPTPAGTSTVTVTVTEGSVVHTTTFSLTVN
jgi:hypothetical protein